MASGNARETSEVARFAPELPEPDLLRTNSI